MGCISFGLPIYDSDLGRWIAYGIFMHDIGIHAIYPSIMSFIIFTGSMEFVAAHFLRDGFAELKLGSLIHMVHAHEKNAVSATIQFFQPAKPVGRIIAHATEIKRSYRLGFY